MTGGAQERLGFSAIGGREAKAEKILAILAAAGSPLKPDDQVLDLGCGSGEIAAVLARHADVSCADAIDQRVQGRELPFHLIDDATDIDERRFDVVISNHVIEHVADARRHLHEIHRLLRPGGAVYLATPNRWWPWEFHARVPLLHYLPARFFSRIAMRLGLLSEPLRLLSLHQLSHLAAERFDVEIWHPRILHNPGRYALHLPAGVTAVLQRLPQWLLQASAGLQPTLILLLRAR